MASEIVLGNESNGGASPPELGSPAAGAKTSQASKELGLEPYYNNPQFSDVRIVYGSAADEHVFHGHKIILASNSHWFRVAFSTEAFKESQDHTITLHGDDPLAMNRMFLIMYGDKLTLTCIIRPEFHGPLGCLDLYEVTDKYDFPMARELAKDEFQKQMESFLAHTVDGTAGPNAREEFFEITRRVYALTERPEKQIYSTLRGILLLVALENLNFQVKYPEGGWNDWVIGAAKEVPDYGADIFNEAMDTNMGILYDQYCFECGEEYVMEQHHGECLDSLDEDDF